MTFEQVTPVRTDNLSEGVAERLRAAIRSGGIPAGTRLVEQEVAEQLGVSRVPVREAIQMLADEGIVRKVPRRGAYVYLPTRKEIDEISSLRVVLERFVVERVMEHWNTQHEATLREIVAKMRTAVQEGNYQHAYEQDYAFHLALWQIADHAILYETVSSLRARIGRFIYEANSALPKEPAHHHVDSHETLIDVLNQGDVAAAKEEVTVHVLAARDRVFAYCALESSDGDGPNATESAPDTSPG